jgi:hypothetical protein
MKRLILINLILSFAIINIKGQEVDVNGKIKFKELDLNCSVRNVKISNYEIVDKFGEPSEKYIKNQSSEYTFNNQGRCIYYSRPTSLPNPGGIAEISYQYDGECLISYKRDYTTLAECTCNSKGLVESENTINRSKNNFKYLYEYDSRNNLIKSTSYLFGEIYHITMYTYDAQNRSLFQKVYDGGGSLLYTYGTEYRTGEIRTFTKKNLGNGISEEVESTYERFNNHGDISFSSSVYDHKNNGSTTYEYVYNTDNTIKTQTSYTDVNKDNFTKVEYTIYDSRGNWIEKKITDHRIQVNNQPINFISIYRREIIY